MNEFITLNPFTARDTKSFLYSSIVHEGIGLTEVVAKWRFFAGNTDIVHVEFRVKRVSNHTVGKELAELGGSNFEFNASFGS